MSVDEAVRQRRLRAALGASADAVLARGEVGLDLLRAEVELLAEVAPEAVPMIWRELRNRVLALAADLPPTPESVDLLERRLAAER